LGSGVIKQFFCISRGDRAVFANLKRRGVKNAIMPEITIVFCFLFVGCIIAFAALAWLAAVLMTRTALDGLRERIGNGQ
jgi:hypothetical protein